jgi:predicted transcriptional regulator
MMAITTSIRMPDDVYEQYETLAQATNWSRRTRPYHALLARH